MTAPIYGNYHDYYSKRSYTNRDPRLARLPGGLMRGKRILDVGCNQGWVTCEIAQVYGASRVVGVDIDAALVSQAWKRRRHVWSLQKPNEGNADPANSGYSYTTNNEGSTSTSHENRELVRLDHFPTALLHMFGPIPLPESLNGPRDTFPLNVTFRAADWVNDGVPEDADGWDVIIGFSVTKWIHLNCGDEGLKAFFQRAFDTLRPGGIFVIEPQEWSSYNKAWRMSSRLKETAQELKLRPESFTTVLESVGFELSQYCGSSGQKGFDRPLILFTKPLSAIWSRAVSIRNPRI